MSCEFPGAVWSDSAGDQDLGLKHVFLGIRFLQKLMLEKIITGKFRIEKLFTQLVNRNTSLSFYYLF